MLKTEQDIIDFIQNNEFMMNALMVAKSANLPDWFVGAGFIRDTVWNIQHGFELDYQYKDLDLGYFDNENMSEELDEEISRQLRDKLAINWEVVNQAYTHTFNNVPPYTSAIDGLAHWVETATSVGVALDENDKVKIIAPWGVDDLLQLKLVLVPCHQGNKCYEDIFMNRIVKKRWLERWPNLKY